MKIGILLLSDALSGAEKVTKELLNNSEDNSNVVLMVSNEIYSDLKIKGLKIYNFGDIFNKNILNRVISCKKIANKVENIIQIEKINLLNPILEYSFLATLFIRTKLPIVCSLHGEDINNLGRLSKIPQNYIVKKALKKSKRLISVSKGLVNNIPDKYKPKTVVISNGVDSKTFKPLDNIKQKKNVVLFVGRFIDIKGIKEIINVAKQLPQYEFWFAGQGELANLINLPNTKNLGFKTTKDLVKLYNQATICVFPSHREALPLCGLEAMSCGRAVIATPLGFSEYIKNGKDGIIIPAKDENALKNTIVDLMTNKKKRKMLEKNARKKALQYSWDKIAKQYLKVFKEVIRR